MATLNLTELKCIRKQDITGSDEPEIYIGGLKVWDGKMKKDDVERLSESRGFSDSVLVELKERDGHSAKSLGQWTITDTPTSTKTLTATSSGYHYQLKYTVAA
ncbi:MAG: hypothetical protein R2708_07565 [Vicinamibacterales bacterium]